MNSTVLNLMPYSCNLFYLSKDLVSISEHVLIQAMLLTSSSISLIPEKIDTAANYLDFINQFAWNTNRLAIGIS